jgi:hypothetical protein
MTSASWRRCLLLNRSVRVKKVCIDDPRLPDGARNVLRVTLSKFAKAENAKLKHVIELYERGFLRIGLNHNGLYVELCTPEEAPQLRTDFTFETGVLS